MRIRLHLLFYFVSILTWASHAQDIQFSQFYAVPVYQNPAFAGSTYMHRFALHQRFQWMRIDARYASSLVGWDTHIAKLNSGVGIIATHDIQGSDKITTDEVSGQYSYELPLTEKYVLRAGAQVGLAWRTIDFSQFRYAQDYNDQGFQGNTYNQYGNNTLLYANIATGAVLFSDKIWLGIASHNMNEPKQTFYTNSNNRLPMQMSFTGGYKYILKTISSKFDKQARTAEYTLVPTFQYKFQGKSDQLDLGLYSQLDRIMVGGWYRGIAFKRYDGIQNNESIVFLAGIRYGNLSFSYSYDFTISRLSRSRTGGSHELNLTFYLERQRNSVKPMKRLPCPDYFD